MKAGVGGDFTITPLYVSLRMGSGWPSGTVFPPLPAPAMLDYQPRSRRRTSAREVRRVRPERHNPSSIPTLRIVLAHQLLRQLPQCPFCGARESGSSSASTSTSATQVCGREWLGAVRQAPSCNSTLLSFSRAIQRHFAGEPSACSPLSLSPAYW